MKPGLPGTVAVAELRNESIDILVDVTDATTMQAALGVTTVRDLSVYPPYLAAREILATVFFPEQLDAFDPEAPADLVPKSGEFPTERVQYTTLVLDSILRPDDAPPLIDSPAQSSRRSTLPPSSIRTSDSAPSGSGCC